MKKKIFALILAASLVPSVLAGCGTSASQTDNTNAGTDTSAEASASDSQTSETASADGEVKTYRIATEGAYAPFNYVNEAGEPDGYDVAVAKAVDELIPEVQFTYEAVEWSSIFAGLEADKYDLIVSEAAKTDEREEKYLFGDVPYSWDVNAIAYKKGRDDIKSIDDLQGKTVTVAVGSSNANIIETYNAEHNDAINVVYGDGDISKALLEVQEGRADATLASPQVAANVIKEQGLDVDYVVRKDVDPVPVYWLYQKDEDGEYLKGLVDTALQTLIDNGKLAEISEQYLGGDYSTKEAILGQ
ncbi:MAG: transporter substrate-binding domain-containing protein [Lachnospiraceae bacterium]|nr:transporter substrate-binding domain-containing protein [Lachnospiraceae bacterium]